MAILDLIRHGEPVGGSRYRGHAINDPLSEKGWQQMREATNGYGKWDRVYTSPLDRCKAFAQEVAEQQNIELHIHENLKEVGFGRWEGKSRQQVKAQFADEYTRFYEDAWKYPVQGAENLQDFSNRVNAAVAEIVKYHPDDNILVVVHAGVIRAILCQVLQAPVSSMYLLSVSNAAMFRIQFEKTAKLVF